MNYTIKSIKKKCLFSTLFGWPFFVIVVLKGGELMDWSRLSNTDTFYQISGLTLLASLLSLILTFIFKRVTKKVWQDKSETQKDTYLRALGRFIAFVTYTLLYLGSDLLVYHQILFDGTFLVSLLSGSSLTISLSKAIYTWMHQKGKEKEESNASSLQQQESQTRWVLTKKQTKEE